MIGPCGEEIMTIC